MVAVKGRCRSNTSGAIQSATHSYPHGVASSSLASSPISRGDESRCCCRRTPIDTLPYEGLPCAGPCLLGDGTPRVRQDYRRGRRIPRPIRACRLRGSEVGSFGVSADRLHSCRTPRRAYDEGEDQRASFAVCSACVGWGSVLGGVMRSFLRATRPLRRRKNPAWPSPPGG